jgi:hypothetical protein
MNSSIAKYLAEIGKRGGEVSSPEKAAAARENGKKGGRPPIETLTERQRNRRARNLGLAEVHTRHPGSVASDYFAKRQR